MGERAPTMIEVGLWILALGAPLALGGVHLPVIVALALVAVALLGALLLRARHTKRRVEVPFFAWALGAVAAWTALQALPLPWGLLELLAPETTKLLTVSLGADALPAWHAISLAPGATLVEALKVSVALIAFIVAHNHLHREARRYRLALALVGVTSFLVLLGLVGAVVSPGKPLLFYQPETVARAGGLITTSFVNANHGGAFLALGAVAALALALAARRLQQRVMLLAATAFSGLGVMLTLSRGAIAALAFGMLGVTIVDLRWRHDRDDDTWTSPQALYIPLALAMVLGLAAWLAYEPILAELGNMLPGQANLFKLELWPSGLTMLEQNPLVGVGRGAFATAFPRYLASDLPGAITFSHLENQFLHLPIELGLPIGGGVILASAWAWLRWLRSTTHEPTTLAFAVALPMVAAHNLVDFNLELLGVALPVAVIAGALSAAATSSRHHRSHHSRTSIRRLRVGALGALGVLTLALSVAVIAAPAHADRDLATRVAAAQTPAAVKEALAGAIAARPADCYPQLLGARALHRLADRHAIRWLNRALYLCPRSVAAHAEAARILDAFGHRHQALGECRLALASGGTSSPPRGLLDACLARAIDRADVDRALPARPLIQQRAIATLIRRRRPKLAAQVAEAALTRWPTSAALMMSALGAHIAAHQWDRARRLGAALIKAHPSPQAYITYARALRPQSTDEAIATLREGRRRYERSLPLRLNLVSFLLAAKQAPAALDEAQKLHALTRSRGDRLAVHSLLARVYRANGRTHRARYEAQQAAKLRRR